MIKIRLNKNYMWSSVNNGNNNNNYYRLLKNTKINIYFDYHNIQLLIDKINNKKYLAATKIIFNLK